MYRSSPCSPDAGFPPQEKQREKETQNALRREKLNDMQYLQVYRR